MIVVAALIVGFGVGAVLGAVCINWLWILEVTGKAKTGFQMYLRGRYFRVLDVTDVDTEHLIRCIRDIAMGPRK